MYHLATAFAQVSQRNVNVLNHHSWTRFPTLLTNMQLTKKMHLLRVPAAKPNEGANSRRDVHACV